MKKDTTDTSDEITTDRSAKSDDSVADKKPTKQDLVALELSRIESVEIVPNSTDTKEVPVVNPDKEVKFIPPVRHESWWKRKKIIIPLAVALLAILLLAVPMSRYALLGWVWYRDITIEVQDDKSGNSVVDASVTIGPSSAATGSDGKATVKNVPIGNHTITVTRPNYAEVRQETTVDILSASRDKVSVTRTGTGVDLVVVDRLTQKPVAEAVLSANTKTVGKTNTNGKIAVVIPVGQKEIEYTVTSPNHNIYKAKIDTKSKIIELVPSGSLYFLSKQSGKIDVVKSNVDGSDRKVILPGQGTEEERGTNLLATRDWKYVMLKTKRTPNKPASLYVITTADDKYSVVDDSNVAIVPVGWSGHQYIYKTYRQAEAWRANSMQLKSYNADTGKTVVIDENASDARSTAQNSLYERFGDDTTFILDNKVVYTKSWSVNGTTPPPFESKQVGVYAAKPDGTDKKVVKSYSATTTDWINARQSGPQGINFRIATRAMTPQYSYAELAGDTFKELPPSTDDLMSKTYLTHLVSPNGEKTFWSEERDGKQVLYIGDKNAGKKQEIIAKSDFKPYGWLSDSLVLIQKDNKELYVSAVEPLKNGKQPLKISDYYQVKSDSPGYGYGYGGQ